MAVLIIAIGSGVLFGGCQIDTHSAMDEASSFSNAVVPIGTVTWFLDQSRAAIQRGDLEAAQEDADKAEKGISRLVNDPEAEDGSSGEFLTDIGAVVGDLARNLDAEIEARKSGDLAQVKELKARRIELNLAYREIMKSTDFESFTYDDPDREYVEELMWSQHHFLTCMRMNSLAGNPQPFDRCNDLNSYPSN